MAEIIDEYLNKKKKPTANAKFTEHLTSLVSEPPLKKRPCKCAICKKESGKSWKRCEKQDLNVICSALQSHYNIRSNRNIEKIENLEEITSKFKDICKENVTFKWVCDKCK